jgi:rhodanese-related sulfurtransferase
MIDLKKLKFISIEDLLEMQANGQDYKLIEVLPEKNYKEGHIPGAINIPWNDLETALEFFENGVWKRADRVKNMANTLKEVFKIEGNDAEAIAKSREIIWELIGTDHTWLERSKTICRAKITKCAWQTEPKDISDWPLIYNSIIAKNINPKASVERPKAMCAGDPYCEYIYRIEE